MVSSRALEAVEGICRKAWSVLFIICWGKGELSGEEIGERGAQATC